MMTKDIMKVRRARIWPRGVKAWKGINLVRICQLKKRVSDHVNDFKQSMRHRYYEFSEDNSLPVPPCKPTKTC